MMRTTRDRRFFIIGWVALVLTSLAGMPAAAALGDESIRVTNVQQVSRDTLRSVGLSQRDTEVEPDLAQDPNSSRHLVTTFQESRYADGAAAAAGYAASRDGGATWKSGELPNLTRLTGGTYERAGDQVAAFGPNGTVYVASTAFDGSQTPQRRSAMAVQRSLNGGFSWRNPIFVARNSDLHIFNDNPAVAVDTNEGSPRFGRIYVAWLREQFTPDFTGLRAPVVMRHSDDGGVTWSKGRTVADPSSNDQGTQVLVQPNGAVSVLWEQVDEHGLSTEVARTSRNGGRTFGPAVTVGSVQWTESPGMRTGFGIASAAVDRITGVLYVVWQDTRFRSDQLNDIVMSQSVNRGISWSPPHRVNPSLPASQVDRFTPDVAAYGGSVAVTYYSRDSYGRSHLLPFVQETYIESRDRGHSFGEEIPLGPAADVRFAALAFGIFPHPAKFLGDYIGVTLSSKEAHAAWAFSSFNGRNTAPHSTIWAATIKRR